MSRKSFFGSIFRFGRDRNDGSFRQERFSGDTGSSGHKEHTWSKTSTDGKHKEGWDGAEKSRTRDKK